MGPILGKGEEEEEEIKNGQKLFNYFIFELSFL
jgi:hypothetical protein